MGGEMGSKILTISTSIEFKTSCGFRLSRAVTILSYLAG